MYLEPEGIVLGQLVHSRAGRDGDRYFLVVGLINKDYVLISDGDLRKIDKPKRKKVKHLVVHNTVSSDLRSKLEEDAKVNNGEIRKYLESLGLKQSNNEEV
jgi:ribosomal protein L14E/L6E/L27E